MRQLVKILDYFFLLRPIVLIPVWFFYLIGVYHAILLNKGKFDIMFFPNWQLIKGFLIVSIVGGTAYIINQIYDIETDKINRKLFLLSDGYISVTSSWIFVFVLYLLLFFLLYNQNFHVKLFTIALVILSFLYSAYPFHFKGRPFFDLFSNAFGNGFLNIGIGYCLYSHNIYNLLVISLPYIFMTGVVFLYTTIPDIEGDKKTGNITTGVYLGVDKTIILGLILLILSITFGIINKDIIALLPILLSLYFFIIVFYKKEVHYFLKAVRLCTASITLIVGILFPFFILIIIFIVLLSRLYYKRRFGIIYPKIFTKDRI